LIDYYFTLLYTIFAPSVGTRQRSNWR